MGPFQKFLFKKHSKRLGVGLMGWLFYELEKDNAKVSKFPIWVKRK
jgi:hypothetical protein